MNRALIVLLSAAFLNHSAFATTVISVVCPEQITTSESIKSVPVNWQSWQPDSAHTWQAVTLYDGHPKEMASLAPDKTNKQKASWHFASTRERDVYIACGYHRSSIELIQVVPKNIKTCVVFYDANSYGEQGVMPKKINCSD